MLRRLASTLCPDSAPYIARKRSATPAEQRTVGSCAIELLFHWKLPPRLVGDAVRLQALQLSPCRVSNVVHVAP
jgi:hypothetical protein